MTPSTLTSGIDPAPPGMVKKYGLWVEARTPEIALELLCYRTKRSPAQGGLGPEAHFRNAFKLMWPRYQMSEWVDLIIHVFCTYKWIVIIGHQRASKTFTMAHCALLDYLAEPSETLTSLATVTFEGLKLRMWGDFQKAVETAKGMPVTELLALRTSSNEMRCYPKEAKKEAAEKFQIHGMAVNQTDNAEGRIRGGHAPRRRIFLDEANNIADPIFSALVNPMSAPDAKAILLTNPVEKVSEFGKMCEPLNAAEADETIYALKHYANGVCLQLDGLKSPNIRAGKNIFTGLLTQESIDEVVRIHGEDSVQYWSLIRGKFPPDGMVARVFPSSTIERGKKSLHYDFRPQWCASLDPAFEHDNCVLHFAELGWPIFGNPGRTVNCKESKTLKLSVSPGSEPKDYQIANQVRQECRERGIFPEHFIMDGTGGGRGVVAILQKEWSIDIQVVNYGGACTDRPLRGDNPKKASELYDRFVSELWFRAAEYVREGLIAGLENLDPLTITDLYARRYELKQASKNTIQAVETKKEMKKRLGRSPDHGDAFVQFGELLIRLGTVVGRTAATVTASGRWDKQKERAKLVNSRHGEAGEFSY